MGSPQPAEIPNPALRGAEWGIEQDIHAIGPKAPIAAAVWGPVHVTGRGECEVLRVAALQRWFANRDQLRAAGLGRGAINHRVSTGRLHPYHPGVYLVGRPSLEPFGAEMAAVLFYNGHAILSHRSAAAIWGLLQPTPGDVVVTTVVDRRSRRGIRVHRTQTLHRRDIRRRQGLPVTSPPRTIIDLAAEASDEDLEEALAVAQMQGLASADEVRAAMHRAPGRKGAARLVRMLDNPAGFTRSEAERRLRGLLRAADLPQPQVNMPLLGHVVDFLWSAPKLVVEVDGFAFHSSRRSFERDRRRDQTLIAAGYSVIRITWRQLVEEPYAVIARIAQAIAARAA